MSLAITTELEQEFKKVYQEEYEIMKKTILRAQQILAGIVLPLTPEEIALKLNYLSKLMDDKQLTEVVQRDFKIPEE